MALNTAPRERVPKTRAEKAALSRELRALDSLSTDELRDKHFELYGYGSKSRNRAGLVRRLYHRVQEIREGIELSDRAQAAIDALAPDVRMPKQGGRAPQDPRGKPRDPRLPAVGETITKTYNGKRYEVAVLDDGFRYQREKHPTLGAVATAITGKHWNGFIFFGLQKRTPKMKGASR